ncbi:Lrp/AsnC family transcriptional regulator [Shewanella aestuarii]|uniref:Lrp/AsnC family transcriptional regulator n=1 Tax=Shewanella aestuarii TaxID=1028752 RepID=A0A6G9QHA4_9GAMM|nr:Lrp/AsnC family transcriptional regulator [Shewanella aestuarii]QIR13281.1 Lrp/AsnC family transcriptional regulator [Shewanella aestuarii]
MDKKDLKLLDILQSQGRIPISDLADKLNMSDTPCLRRVKKLEQDKVIKGYCAQLDSQKLGWNVTVYAFIRLTNPTEAASEEFELAIAKFAQVMECSAVTGADDYLLKIVAKDLASYQRFEKSVLGSLPCVANINSTLVLKQHLSRTGLPLSD